MTGDRLLQLIQKAIDAALKDQGPVKVMYGKVEVLSPIRIIVDDRFPIFGGMVLLSPFCYPNWQTIQGEQVVLWPGLAADDRVQLLRLNGGSHYYVFGKEGGI